ncbi:hypothetical protein [Pseudomonas sp. H3_C08]
MAIASGGFHIGQRFPGVAVSTEFFRDFGQCGIGNPVFVFAVFAFAEPFEKTAKIGTPVKTGVVAVELIEGLFAADFQRDF